MATPERLQTIEEVAAHFAVTPRLLREMIKRHQIPVLRSSRRIVRFDTLALRSLEEALRCRSESPAAPTARTFSRSKAVSRANEFASVLNRITDGSRKRRLPPSRPKFSEASGMASVVALDPSRKR
jgi:hypothetical protein